MRPILFSVGSLNFYSYGFFTALGFLAAGRFIHYLAKQQRLLTAKTPPYFLIDALLFALVSGLVTARLSYIIVYSLIFRLEPLELSTQLVGGGFIFYFGLLGGLLALGWWLGRKRTPVMPWLDLLMPGIFLGLAVSEIGGYLNDGQVVHLVGLVGSGMLTALTYLILISQKQLGRTFMTGLFLLFLLFFFLGFWRLEEIIWYGFNLGQWVSLLGMIAVGLSIGRWQR